ncbi:D-alanyl-D-alanine carboxypeptidase/D-alanyl-D-alanine-endopeptidase [Virgibacillus byunsanensis]|uniref:D-alanyl-D-alanine carboxypeptidase/D-alanyl-D-alanine-endopeptidase n=1 Tax=Virgibacillus byunsanensis TaxID=570945 RepID=A0ABW3LRF9_9BACI
MKKQFYVYGTLIITMLIIVVVLFPTSKNNKTVNDVEEAHKLNQESKAVINIEENNTVMKQQLDDYINNDSKLEDALIGISVRSAKTGEQLYNNMGNIRMRPASNMKLLTATAALSTLGEDYKFTTEILKDSSINGNSLQGNLYLKGKGDPTLLPSNFDNFALDLSEKGIEKIEGDIVADDTWYDDVRLSPDLIWSDEHYYYGAQVSALTASPSQDYDAGTVIVEVSPGDTVGARPNVSLSPNTDYVTIDNNATTVATNVEDELTVERDHGTNNIVIKGEIPVGSVNVKEWMAVWEPTTYALDFFQKSLQEQGISWTGSLKTGVTPEDAEAIITHQSMPLSELLVPFMKLSNNGHAETLIKEMGKIVYGEGSWDKGIEVTENVLSELGMNMDTIMIRDGSGLSHINLIPPNEISNLLYLVQKEEWFSSYLHSLPDAGEADRMVGGTLRHRMKETSVRAKTGTIYGVSTLSGYVETNSGEPLIFSVMVNNLMDEDDGPEIEDRIVEIIAEQN